MPDILLLDEPLSNIEENMRVEFRKNLKSLAQDNGISVVYVTHNQTEIAEVADKVAVMYQGRFEQTGTFIDLYENPKRYFVSLFVGEKTTNFLTASEVADATGGNTYSLTVRPNECRIAKGEVDPSKGIVLRGETAMIENFVSERRKIAFLELSRGGYDNLFGVEVPIDYEIVKGDPLTIEVPFDAAKFFEESGDRIFNLW
jgi:ABC-type sugar transport system ATPase subunit